MLWAIAACAWRFERAPASETQSRRASPAMTARAALLRRVLKCEGGGGGHEAPSSAAMESGARVRSARSDIWLHRFGGSDTVRRMVGRGALLVVVGLLFCAA